MVSTQCDTQVLHCEEVRPECMTSLTKALNFTKRTLSLRCLENSQWLDVMNTPTSAVLTASTSHSRTSVGGRAGRLGSPGIEK